MSCHVKTYRMIMTCDVVWFCYICTKLLQVTAIKVTTVLLSTRRISNSIGPDYTFVLVLYFKCPSYFTAKSLAVILDGLNLSFKKIYHRVRPGFVLRLFQSTSYISMCYVRLYCQHASIKLFKVFIENDHLRCRFIY